VVGNGGSVGAGVEPASVYVVALDLGWELAELYQDPHTPRAKSAAGKPQQPASDELPLFLSTAGQLAPSERTRLSIARVRLAVRRLEPVFVASDLKSPSVDEVVHAFERGDLTQLKVELVKLHDDLLFGLHVVDRNLGKSYDLGRGLVYTCRRPSNWTEVRAQFQRFRLATLSGWLADLSTFLPDHACRGVGISLGIWQEAIPDPAQQPRIGQLSIESGSDAEDQLLGELRRQAGLWRNVLVAAKNPEQMLGAGDYISALGRLAKRVFRLLFSRRTYFLVPILLLAAGAAIYLLLSSDGKEINKIVGAIAIGAGSLGITAGGIRTTLGRWASKAEQPLWAAEIDVAIGGAITTLHQDFAARVRLRPARIAAAIVPARGPDTD
jgi:hypothetical protein